MSQDYTDDCFASDHVVQTDMANIEKNFAALKSAFSGATAPSNLVAGMWWLDTATHILKKRNEVNNAWFSIWDMANNKPFVVNNISSDFGAALKDPVVGTAGLRTLGTGAQQAMPGNQETTPDNSVTFEKIQHGTVTIAGLEAERSGKSAGYMVISPEACIFIPGDATLIKMLCDLKVVTDYAHETYIKFTVGGTDSSEAFTTASGVWQNEKVCELDVSGKSGRNAVKVLIKSQHDTDATYHTRNICLYWE